MKLKKCISTINYFSVKLNDIASATFVCEKNNLCFIQNSFEKIWIEKNKITLID